MTKQEEIEQLKAEQDVVVPAHYYVSSQVQGVADYIGDSLCLSKVTAGLNRRTMVLYGVSLMEESGKLLSLDKVVLMLDAQVDYPMVHMVIKEGVERYRREYPDLAVVCYINSTTKVRSWLNVCIMSTNTVQIARNLSDRDIPFIPDKNLERYVASQMPEKHVMPVNGCCPVHDQMSPKEVSTLEKIHPDTQVLAHPECNAQVLELANYIDPTTGILKFAAGSASQEFIVCAENGVRYKLERRDPDRHFYSPDTGPIYWDMKKITLNKIIHVLRIGQNQAPVPKAYVPPAGRALEQMLNLARQPPENGFQAVDLRQSIS